MSSNGRRQRHRCRCREGYAVAVNSTNDSTLHLSAADTADAYGAAVIRTLVAGYAVVNRGFLYAVTARSPPPSALSFPRDLTSHYLAARASPNKSWWITLSLQALPPTGWQLKCSCPTL